mmetsp:Transcript_88815/g.248589  ORF Transcript_88815/g.248589 Transcript_88815/m.248589 type:complete len:289 (-) Transcript_88815:1899-2765(-)
MGSTCLVTMWSPKSFSRLFSGRMRQKTRMEPLRSSTVLCNFFRRSSASWSSVSGTPTASACAIAAASFSFAALTESTSFISHPRLSSAACMTPAKSFFRSAIFVRRSTASWYSETSNLAPFAFSMAAANLPSSTASTAASSSSLALALGSSSSRSAWALSSVSFSKPASRPCWMANFSAATSKEARASSKAFCAFSLDSAPDTSSTNSLKSSSAMPTFLAVAMAVLSSGTEPWSLATLSCLRASSLGSSAFSVSFALSMSALHTPAASAFAMASRKALQSFSSMATLR